MFAILEIRRGYLDEEQNTEYNVDHGEYDVIYHSLYLNVIKLTKYAKRNRSMFWG